MKFCIIIPCYNHSDNLNTLLGQLPSDVLKIVVDDGSDEPVSASAQNLQIFRFAKNSGKANALKKGFELARQADCTHAITIDSDGQHPVESLSEIVDVAQKNPQNIIVATRDFDNSAIPSGRKFLNKFSNFWFWAETGKTLADTQCGYRCYPLALLEKLDIAIGGFCFEVELLVKAAWAGFDFSEVKIPAIYNKQTLEKSHYRPIVDTFRFTMMNTRLFFTSLFLSKKMLKKISLKK